jgi:hypothetical protein
MPMDYSGDEGNEGTRDWKPRANRVVEELSAQDSSNDDDKGDLGEYLTGPVMEATSARSWGGGRSRGPAEPTANLLTHAYKSENVLASQPAQAASAHYLRPRRRAVRSNATHAMPNVGE